MSFLKNFREKYLQSNLSLAIIAIFISVFLWLFIALNQCPIVQKTVAHVPVSLDISSSSASLNNLNVITCDIKEVTVVLRGSRTQVGSLNSDNLEAYFNADSVTNPGTKKLSLEIRSSSGKNYEVESVYPASASVVFDKIDTREFPVTPQLPNITAANGKEINWEEVNCEPSVVRITGPSVQLDKISKVMAVSNKSATLSTSYNLASDEIQLYTEENALIDQSQLKIGDMNIQMMIPIRIHKEVKLYVSLMNAPDSFNKDSVKLKLSDESVLLACNNTQVEIPDSMEVGYVSLNELKPGFTKTFSISSALESTDFINVSNLEAVTVELDDEGLAQREIKVNRNRIKISNAPDSSYDYSVLTNSLNVTIVGPEDVISQVGSDDIVADVNLLNANLNSDQFNWNASFSCPEFDNVWVVSSVKVSVQRTKKPATTTAP